MYQVSFSSLNVLVVEDSKSQRELLVSVLQETGIHRISSVVDGSEALSALKKFPAHLVITDLHMAPMDGIDLTLALRTLKTSPNPALPILLLTSRSNEKDVLRAQAAGVHGFILKPYTVDNIRSRIVEIFSKPLLYEKQGDKILPARWASS